MLDISSVTVRYGQHRALEDASITVAKGEIVVILGANGAGKSTLLKAASGICEGEVTGSVTLDGTSLLGQAANRIVDAGLALVPEGRGVFPDLTVRENLTLGAYSSRARANETTLLDRVYTLFPKLKERGKQIVRTMSGGEQQMVAIGRAMMSNPTILTLDEPSLGLSPLLSKELFQNLAKVRDLGLGVLLVEQNAKQSLAIADRGYLLENAHVVHEDSAAALMQDPAVQAAYLGGSSTQAQPDRIAPATPDAGIADMASIVVAPKSQQTISADVVLGRSISDLVATASAQRSPPSAQEPVRTPPASPAPDRLSALLSEIEQGAKAARQPTAPPAQTRRPAATEHTVSDPTPAQDRQPPPVIEVYRAPRIEIYRRRPDGSGFDNI